MTDANQTATATTSAATARIQSALWGLKRDMPQTEISLLQAILTELRELNTSIYEMRTANGE